MQYNVMEGLDIVRKWGLPEAIKLVSCLQPGTLELLKKGAKMLIVDISGITFPQRSFFLTSSHGS